MTTTTTQTEPISDILGRLERHPEELSTASVSRFPYTYAYDFIRSNAQEFRLPPELVGSRAGVAGWYNDTYGDDDLDDDSFQGLVDLADAYMREHRLWLPESERLARIAGIQTARQRLQERRVANQNRTTL